MNKSYDEPDRAEGDINIGHHRAQWYEQQLSTSSRDLLSKDAQFFLHQALSTPCLNALKSSSDSTLTDLQDRNILDFHGNSAHHVGYGHPKVIEAVKQQLDTLPFCPRRYTNQTAVNLAIRLCTSVPMADARVLFAPGGTAAISMALKLARLNTGRFKTVSWWDAFHGGSLDAISIGGEAMFRRNAGPLLPGALHVPPPGAKIGDHIVSSTESADHLEYVIEHEGDIAAFIAEPIRCTGVVQPPASYWQRIRKICDRHNALLIFDEIPLGLGRTGSLFACEYADVVPDMVCWGKGLGGGVFPMAALIARSEFNTAVDSSIGHFTHEKSPVGCAAALATLDILQNDGILDSVNMRGQQTHEELLKIQQQCSAISEVRSVGMLHGIQLNSNDLAEATLYASLRRGLSFKVSCGNTLTLAPPLTISNADLTNALSILESALTEAVDESNE